MIFKEHFTGKNILFIIGVAVFFIFLSHISDVALLFFGAFVVACSLNPIIDKLEKKMPRMLASTLLILLSLLLLIGLFLPLVFLSIKEFSNFVQALPDKIEMLYDFLQFPLFGHPLSDYLNLQSISYNFEGILANIVDKSIGLTKGLFTLITIILTMLVIVFYLTSDKESIKTTFLNLFPPKIKDRAEQISETICTKTGNYVFAQVISMVFVGLATMIGLAIIQNENTILLGFITAILDIIPVVGPTIAVIIAMILAAGHGFGYVVLVLLILIAAQWLQNHILRPVLFGKFMDIHPLTIIFALFVAGKFLGVWGVVLAPALASMICILFDELYVKTINREKTKD